MFKLFLLRVEEPRIELLAINVNCSIPRYIDGVVGTHVKMERTPIMILSVAVPQFVQLAYAHGRTVIVHGPVLRETSAFVFGL